MNYHLCVITLLLIALTNCQRALSLEIDTKNPVRSAREDEIKTLPGLDYALNFKQYSGYLKADNQEPTNRFWHYWFVESQSNPANDPLVLWLNGGPGCSSLLGLLTELGPFSVSNDNELVENHYTWNKNANIIFLESPAGVGFSYALDGSVQADDDSTAAQNHRALQSFFQKFPHYKNHSLYLTGESYGGVYLPTLAVLVDDDPEMNLKGVAIGNGYLNANKLAESLVFFSYYHGLVGGSTWNGLSTNCCDGKPPARGKCRFTDINRSAECSNYVNQAVDDILNSGLNPYNLYDMCAQPSSLLDKSQEGRHVSREHFDKSLMLSAFNITTPSGSRLLSSMPKMFKNLQGDPPCSNDAIIINYLNSNEVKKALHIPANLTQKFETCFDGIKYTMIYPGKKEGLAPQMLKLIDSKNRLVLLVYNGDTDMMCNFLGDEWFVDDLNRVVLEDYKPWTVNGQVAGFVKRYDGITYVTIKGSGHMVPTDKPVEALDMFQRFLQTRRDP